MMTATATAAMASATGHSMAGMNMGGGCKISMLWNWNTVGACKFFFPFFSFFFLSLFFYPPNFRLNKRKKATKEKKGASVLRPYPLTPS